MTLREFRDMLCTLEGVPVFHKKAQKVSEYIVWQEVNCGLGFDGDGCSAEHGKRIAVDFYTKSEYSNIPQRITELLSACDEICFDGPVVDYEEDTGCTHYAFDAEVYGSG